MLISAFQTWAAHMHFSVVSILIMLVHVVYVSFLVIHSLFCSLFHLLFPSLSSLLETFLIWSFLLQCTSCVLSTGFSHLLSMTVWCMAALLLPSPVALRSDTELFLLPSKINLALSGQRSCYPCFTLTLSLFHALSFLLPLCLCFCLSLFKISQSSCICGNISSLTYLHHFISFSNLSLTLISCLQSGSLVYWCAVKWMA